MDLKYQPAKIAAVEGHWENQPGESLPLILFGLPDMNAETTRYAVQIPHLGSLAQLSLLAASGSDFGGVKA
jgi:cytochrome d ubiquinol oxidase subunit I